VSLQFFNRNESFKLNALYTGKASKCEVTCRLPDATVQVYTLPELYRMNARRDRWKFGLMMLASASLAIVPVGIALLKKLFQP
jgi:hypothetical protein